jgi:thiosulfate/3-mercaptopyruvate sulfurtransferase
MFRGAGIQPGDRVVSYCHIGLQATMAYFTARYLGYDARLYDGSWEDWSAHTELPAETAAH